MTIAMKDIISIFIILGIIFQSCTNHNAIEKRLQHDLNETYIVNADSCEYIIFLDQHNNKYLTHRGRCKFCKQHK